MIFLTTSPARCLTALHALILVLAGSLMSAESQDKPPRIFLAGDSTVATYAPESAPQAGWGQMLPRLFTESVDIRNYAVGGATSRNYLSGGRWQRIMDEAAPGDHVFIQFGHNDQYARGDEFVPVAEYQANLTRMVTEANGKKLHPYLIIPPNSGDFAGSLAVDLHKKYAQAMRTISLNAPASVIDLHIASLGYFNKLGKAETLKTCFMWFPAGTDPRFPDGKYDTWHFSETGAMRIAEMVVQSLHDQANPLDRYARLPGRKPDPKP